MTIYGILILEHTANEINKLVLASNSKDHSVWNSFRTAAGRPRNPTVSTGKQVLGSNLVDTLNREKLIEKTSKADADLLKWLKSALMQFKQDIIKISGTIPETTYSPIVDKTIKLAEIFYMEVDGFGLLDLEYSTNDAYSVLLYHAAKYCFSKSQESQDYSLSKTISHSPVFATDLGEEKKDLLKEMLSECAQAIRGCDPKALDYLVTRTKRILDQLQLLLGENRNLIRDNQIKVGLPSQVSIVGVGFATKMGPGEGKLKDLMQDCMKAITAIKNPVIVIEPSRVVAPLENPPANTTINPLLETPVSKTVVLNVSSGVDIKSQNEDSSSQSTADRNRLFNSTTASDTGEVLAIETQTAPS